MTAVEIENVLATPELHELVEQAEQTGSLRYTDLQEVLEPLHLDPLETDAVFGDFVAGDDPLPEEHVEVSLRSQALTLALQSLPDRERQVLVLRYGLIDEEPKTLEEIGRRLGLTRERVRQIETEALKRLARLREMEAVAGG